MQPSDLHQQRYEQFSARVAGDDAEDLSRVFTHVRLQSTGPTKARWANRVETRTFSLLALDLLYRTYFQERAGRPPGSSEIVFPGIGPERLAEHANLVIRNPDEAEKLSGQRWRDIWSNQANFNEDLIAFLFRPAPYVARTHECQEKVRYEILDAKPRLGTLVRRGVETEIKANLDDPLADLQAFVEASFPRNGTVQQHSKLLDEAIRDKWASFYERVLSAYGLVRPIHCTWRDLGLAFTTTAEGVLQRARKLPDHQFERLSTGDDVLSVNIISMIAYCFDLDSRTVESLELERPDVVDLLAADQ